MSITIALSHMVTQAPLGAEDRLCNLPSFPAAAIKLLQLSDDEDLGSRISHIMAGDPSLAAEVLRLANSPMFGIRNEIRSIEHAVIFLGMGRVSGLSRSR